ncbi:MAG: MoxR family ATPase [Planctomycetia bacterium]|nr:MoxR family ATPase [Planctomycetia bacterium]
MISSLTQNIERVFIGKREVIRFCLTALLAGEHILLEDVPGVGKTLLAHALARSIDGSFHRIQFTPDLLPADITGSSIFHGKMADFREGNPFTFLPGPIFANIVLADEINRATPRTQSAMLEAMGEKQVTSDGQTRALPQPFMVIATENPMEFEGTFPLPESQLDRFQMRISVGYPDRDSERQILASRQKNDPLETLQPVITLSQLLDLQEKARQVILEESLQSYILDLARKTRESEICLAGISTRGVLALSRAAKAYALTWERDYVIPDDIKTLAVPVLSHRLITKNHFRADRRAYSEAFIQEILNEVPVP